VSLFFIAMVSGAPVTHSSSATQPMVFAHSMGMTPFLFLSGTSNHDTQPIPWASNPFSHGISDMYSHFPSSISSPYVNPSFGSRGIMPTYSPFSFGGSHIPQLNIIVGGWNIPSYGSNPIFIFPGESAQMGSHSTYYIPSIYLSSTMSVPMNYFPMVDLHLSSSVSSRGSDFYSMGNPLHEAPSSGRNIYPHLSNPCHVTFSLQADSSTMMPLQPFMNQFRGGYFPIRQGHGVYQNPSWPTISQNQSFLNLCLKFHNQLSTFQSLQVILTLYHQPLLVMLEIGQKPTIHVEYQQPASCKSCWGHKSSH
jgi:hypothetical protein